MKQFSLLLGRINFISGISYKNLQNLKKKIGSLELNKIDEMIKLVLTTSLVGKNV